MVRRTMKSSARPEMGGFGGFGWPGFRKDKKGGLRGESGQRGPYQSLVVPPPPPMPIPTLCRYLHNPCPSQRCVATPYRFWVGCYS